MNKGEVLGKYRLLDQLGEGAAGQVFLATPAEAVGFAKPGDPLALKIYKSFVLDQPNQDVRIEKEFKVGSGLSHPNLVKIHEYRPAENARPPYLVMEYVDGVTLDRWLKLFHPISGVLLLRLVGQLVDAVAFLHENGITHRDLKPSNIMFSSDFSIKVMDFGVVRIKKDTPITPDDKFLGTIRNASPEMLFGTQYDNRTDLYSLGTVIYALLHGREIFSDETQFARLVTLKQDKNPTCDPAVPGKSGLFKGISDLAMALLDREPDKRPSIADLRKRIEELEVLVPETPDLEPLHGYMATALTGLDGDAREAIIFTSNKVAEVAKEYQLYVYEPRKATDPVLNADVDAAAVYLLDRSRVLSADVLFILANKPSFGVGQELEIAAGYGKPTIIIAREGTRLSKMVTGSFANLLDNVIYYQTPEDLAAKLSKSLSRNLEMVRSSKMRDFFQRPSLGQKLSSMRSAAGYSCPTELAVVLGVSPRLVEAIENGQLENVGVEILAKIAGVLRVPIGGFFSDTEVHPASVGDGNLRSLAEVSRSLGWSAKDYLDLCDDYRKELAASGRRYTLSPKDWVARHNAQESRRLNQPGLPFL